MPIKDHPVIGGAYAPPFSLAFFAPRFWPAWLGLALLRLSVFIPRRLWGGISMLLGEVYYRFSVKRKRVARINVGLCFPDWSQAAQATLVRRHFHVAAQCLFDIGWIWWARRKTLIKKIKVVGLEHYQNEYARGRNIILLTCHNVALEVGVIISHYFPHVSVIKPPAHKLLDWLLVRGRTQFGGHVFARAQGLRPALRALKHGAGIYYLPDEDLGLKESIFAPFFSVPAATLTTVGRMATLCDAVVLPCFAYRLPGSQGYELRISAPLDHFPSGDVLADTTRMNQELERGIRAAPEQYLWTYKRFKHRPDNMPSPYD